MDILTTLGRLLALHAKGTISKEQLEAARARILAGERMPFVEKLNKLAMRQILGEITDSEYDEAVNRILRGTTLEEVLQTSREPTPESANEK